MKFIFKIVIFNLWFLSNNYAQTPEPKRNIDSIFFVKAEDTLLEKYGTNKFLIPKFKLQCLIALSYYPALTDVKIKFKCSNISTTMQCRPTVYSLIRKTSKRKYVILINKKKNFEGVLLDNVPFNAQIGVIGHEFAHIIDYKNKKIIGLLNRGFEYLSVEKKKKFEKFIDSLTIRNGLGWQLYDWEDFVLNKSNASSKYKDFKRSSYLTPLQIEAIINDDDKYVKCKK